MALDSTPGRREPVHDYLILGAGPAGLQLGHSLERAGRDYLIVEGGEGPGTFFSTFPRHRKLLSTNRFPTGSSYAEGDLRGDWNSLLCDDGSLLCRHYSRCLFP